MQTNQSELRRKTSSYPLRFEKKVRLGSQLVAGNLAGKTRRVRRNPVDLLKKFQEGGSSPGHTFQ